MFHYYHRDKSPLFSVGPIDMTIRRGEVVFVVGGNGSGKSTLMKLLTGLYYPESGRILVDGKPVMRSDYPDYRELFSIIFTDFHLFERLYGIDEYDEEMIHRLLKQMELDRKTDFVDGAFTNIQLSTGQRKRMAMITALLEDKPVYVFDEWAADQDPTFREYFYNEQLKKMKESGKTIIAVSHDDRFFHFADRVLKMDFGRFVPFA
jgi:putative ATP-binding cassette transporter